MENKTNVPLPEWLKIVLKVVAYGLGLILAGVGTMDSAHAMGII